MFWSSEPNQEHFRDKEGEREVLGLSRVNCSSCGLILLNPIRGEQGQGSAWFLFVCQGELALEIHSVKAVQAFIPAVRRLSETKRQTAQLEVRAHVNPLYASPEITVAV